MKTIKTIDLFAGIGGMRIGVELAARSLKLKHKNVFSSEIDKYCCQLYELNFGEKPFGDITKPKNSEIDKIIPNHDLLLAGFPCQPFSQAGLKKGFEDTRGTLFYDILRILKKKKPKAFLLENVSNLKGHDNGRTLKIILENLNKIGYSVPYPEILSSKDFGLPQNRRRIFIVGFLKKLRCEFEWPSPINKNTKVGDILEPKSKVPKKYFISNKLWAGHKRRKKQNKLDGKGFGFGLVNSKSQYTNTISARYYKDGSEILIQQGSGNPRKLMPVEAKRLQGFPKTFKISSISDAQLYKQFGNSVSVNVIKEISKNIIKSLQGKKIKNYQLDLGF